jgi:two-component system response regulator NreC
MSPKIRVVLADDHTLFREGIKAILSAEPSIEVIGEANDGRQAVEKVSRLEPDVALLDVGMPGLNGVEATRRIKRRKKQVKILMLTMYQEEEMVARCLEAGASGYVLKDAPPGQLVYAIESVHRGEKYLSPGPLARIVSNYMAKSKGATDDEDPLSEREREILILLAEGKSIKEIASELELSVKTVDVHKYNLMKKLDIHNRAALVKYAIVRGILPIRP